jgi:transcriptional regulator with XRE-family HTH domain
VTYAGEHVIAALKAARMEKGLSQRDLSKQTGVPQSHISKIETGAVDIQLSSLIELARVLGLEVMPVPRKLAPAVQTIVRSGESETFRQTENTRQALKHLKRIRKNLNRLRAAPESARDLLSLQRIVTELENFRIGPNELELIRHASDSLQKVTAGPKAQQNIQRATNELRRLRNNLAHNVTEPPPTVRPAYALDEEDGDA